MKLLRKVYSKLRLFLGKHKILIFIPLLVIFLFLFYKISIILFFILTGALSLIHTIFTRNYVGFELCTLVTVITSMQYGLMAGITVGIASITLGLTLSLNLDPGIVISIIGFALIAMGASFFNLQQIVIAGMVLTITYDVLLAIFYYFMGSNPTTILSFSITHVVINFFVFTSLAPIFISMTV